MDGHAVRHLWDAALAPNPNDAAGLSITVIDVNEAPAVALSNTVTTLGEDTARGLVVRAIL